MMNSSKCKPVAWLIWAMGLFSVTALATDAEPVMKTKQTGGDETYTADVYPVTGKNRIGVDATQAGSWTVIQGAQGVSTSPWYVNLRNAAGTEIGTASVPLRTDPTGTTTQPVSAVSWPLPTGAATLTGQTDVTGTKAPGTAATKSLLAGCVYNSAGVTLTDGQQAACQANASGAVKVDANFTVLGGQLVPTITNKFRVRYSTASAVVGSAYTTLYTRSGTGLFFGFQADFNSANVYIKVTIDGGQIYEVTVADLKLFQFNDTTTTRVQNGAFFTTIGNTVDFSSKFPIPYTSSVLVEIKRTDSTNHQLNQYMVFLTEDT